MAADVNKRPKAIRAVRISVLAPCRFGEDWSPWEWDELSGGQGVGVPVGQLPAGRETGEEVEMMTTETGVEADRPGEFGSGPGASRR